MPCKKPPVLKLLILLCTAYAMLRMWHWKIGFTYFTQLSNLFAAGAVLFQLVRRGSPRAFLVKYAAAVSIFITFLVFLLVLAPAVPGGLLAAYRQDHWASLCMHGITPCITIADFLKNDVKAFRGVLTKRHIFLSLLPSLVYYGFVLVLRFSGVRWAGMTAPYFFLNDSAPAGWFGWMPETAGPYSSGAGVVYALLLMLVLFLLAGWLLQLAAACVSRYHTRDEA